MFLSKIEKKVYSCTPHLYNIKLALKRSSIHGLVFNDVNFEQGLKNRKSAIMKIPLPWLRAYKTIAVLLRFYCALDASTKFRIVTRSPSNGMSVLELFRFCKAK